MLSHLFTPMLLCLAVISAGFAPCVWAQVAGQEVLRAADPVTTGPPLGYAEALDLAVKNQPLITARQAAVDASLAEVVTASQLPDPRLKLGIQSVPTNNFSLTQDSFTERWVAVEQVVPREEKRRLRSERARIEGDTGTMLVEELKRSTSRDAAVAWLSVYGAERGSELLSEASAIARRQREALKITFASGKASLSSLKRLDVEIALLEDRVAEVRGETRRARAELTRWVGLDAQREIARDLPSQPAPKELKYLQKVLERKPALTVARQQVFLAENDLAQSRAAKLPDWSFEVGYAKRGPAFADFISAQISFDLPLFTANRQDRNIYAKQRQVDQQLQEHAAHVREMQAELALAYADWVQFSERVEAYENIVLRDAKQRVEAILIEYRSGPGDLGAVLEAQRAEADARLQLLALRVKAAKARAQLIYLAE